MPVCMMIFRDRSMSEKREFTQAYSGNKSSKSAQQETMI